MRLAAEKNKKSAEECKMTESLKENISPTNLDADLQQNTLPQLINGCDSEILNNFLLSSASNSEPIIFEDLIILRDRTNDDHETNVLTNLDNDNTIFNQHSDPKSTFITNSIIYGDNYEDTMHSFNPSSRACPKVGSTENILCWENGDPFGIVKPVDSCIMTKLRRSTEGITATNYFSDHDMKQSKDTDKGLTVSLRDAGSTSITVSEEDSVSDTSMVDRRLRRSLVPYDLSSDDSSEVSMADLDKSNDYSEDEHSYESNSNHSKQVRDDNIGQETTTRNSGLSNSVEEELVVGDLGRKRRIKADPSQWKRTNNKRLRMEGKSYMGFSKGSGGKMQQNCPRQERQMKPHYVKNQGKGTAGRFLNRRGNVFSENSGVN